MIDSSCGRKYRNDCPKYCNQGIVVWAHLFYNPNILDVFRDLYCELGCVEFNTAARSLICVDDYFNYKYQKNASKTFKGRKFDDFDVFKESHFNQMIFR